MLKRAVLAILPLCLLAAGCTQASRTAPPVETTTSTLSALDESMAELESLVEQQRALTDWVESPEHQAATREWEAHLQAKMREYVISLFLAGEIPEGSCAIGETGISIDCDAYAYFSEDLAESKRFGACSSYLYAVGCEDFGERFTASWQRIYEERIGGSG